MCCETTPWSHREKERIAWGSVATGNACRENPGLGGPGEARSEIFLTRRRPGTRLAHVEKRRHGGPIKALPRATTPSASPLPPSLLPLLDQPTACSPSVPCRRWERPHRGGRRELGCADSPSTLVGTVQPSPASLSLAPFSLCARAGCWCEIVMWWWWRISRRWFLLRTREVTGRRWWRRVPLICWTSCACR